MLSSYLRPRDMCDQLCSDGQEHIKMWKLGWNIYRHNLIYSPFLASPSISQGYWTPHLVEYILHAFHLDIVKDIPGYSRMVIETYFGDSCAPGLSETSRMNWLLLKYLRCIQQISRSPLREGDRNGNVSMLHRNCCWVLTPKAQLWK